jgi:NAD(P)-dependent dehydrogenase (short-subunit alcohol dehydrogenase family)
MPRLDGKIAVVTGANSGLGFETSHALTVKGAKVIMTSRNMEKGEAAAEKIRQEYPQADVEVWQLDLADLDSIQRFAHKFKSRYPLLDILVNNAGVMALPHRQETADGFEMQFGTNHLGHFALTGLLIDPIRRAPAARVVTVSSGAHRMGNMEFGDLNWDYSYDRWSAYGRSKLANLLFAYELQRKLAETGTRAISVAAHPGYAATNLQSTGPAHGGANLQSRLMAISNRLLAQSQEMGALPILNAATAEDVHGGDYIGPGGLMEARGYPKHVESSEKSHNRPAAQKLWSVSEELTGVNFEFDRPVDEEMALAM